MSTPTELTADQLIRRIENEGLSYAVNDYYGRDIVCVDDPKLEELWKAVYDATEALKTYVNTLRK